MTGRFKEVAQNLFFEKYLKAGDFFGELSLIGINQKNFCYQASVFTVVETFTINKYKELKRTFPSVQYRIKKGFQQYKRQYYKLFLEIIRYIDVFKEFSEEEIITLYNNFLVLNKKERDQILIRPTDQIDRFYILLEGSMNVCYPDDNCYYDVVDNYVDFINCRDKNLVYLQKYERYLERKQELQVGDFFGCVNIDPSNIEIYSKYYYVTEALCVYLTIDFTTLQKNSDMEISKKIIDVFSSLYRQNYFDNIVILQCVQYFNEPQTLKCEVSYMLNIMQTYLRQQSYL